MNNTNPYRHRNVSAQSLIDCTLVDCCVIERKVNDELEMFGR